MAPLTDVVEVADSQVGGPRHPRTAGWMAAVGTGLRFTLVSRRARATGARVARGDESALRGMHLLKFAFPTGDVHGAAPTRAPQVGDRVAMGVAYFVWGTRGAWP